MKKTVFAGNEHKCKFHFCSDLFCFLPHTLKTLLDSSLCLFLEVRHFQKGVKMWSPCFPRDSSLLFSALSLNQTLCRPEDGRAHWQNWGVYSRLAPLDFDSLLSLKGPLHAGYGRLMARLTTAADDDGCLQIYSPAACSFQHGVWEHACTLAYAAYLGGRWCKHAGMAALFKSGRVVWTVMLRLRSHRGLQRSCSASITTTAATAGPPKPDRLRQGELSDCALFADQCPLF